MIGEKLYQLVVLAFMLGTLTFSTVAQQPAVNAPATRGIALEVMYAKGAILAYQRIGEWTWYEGFRRQAEWKPGPGVVPVAAVRIATRLEDGIVKARVTVLRGRNHETEDFVAEYLVSTEKPTVIRELADLGVEPFEIILVRAPATVADPPAIVNKTKSLEVSVEPTQSTIPTFSARVLNNSPKPVAAFSYYTFADGRRRLIGQPRNKEGGALIKPGDSYELKLRQAMKVSTVSNGEVPSVVPDMVFNVTSVVFTDGTYEGDAYGAANYLAGNAAEKAMLRRFLDLIRSKEFARSEEQVEAAIAAVSIDAITAEMVQKFPTLSADEKGYLRDAVDFGKSLGVKLFRTNSAEPTPALAERLQKRIDALP